MHKSILQHRKQWINQKLIWNWTHGAYGLEANTLLQSTAMGYYAT